MKENVNTEELKEAARETYRRLQNVLDGKIGAFPTWGSWRALATMRTS